MNIVCGFIIRANESLNLHFMSPIRGRHQLYDNVSGANQTADERDEQQPDHWTVDAGEENDFFFLLLRISLTLAGYREVNENDESIEVTKQYSVRSRSGE